MARKLRGSVTVKVDSKGRMAIPARLRRVFDLGDPSYAESTTGRTQLVAVHGPEEWNWIELYSIDAIDEIDDQISQMPRGSQKRRWLELLMNGQSMDLEIDRENRLILPARLREKLGFVDGAETIFESRGDYIQVYLPDSRPKDVVALEEFAAGYGPGFDPREFLQEG
ncbi:cell division/cell wall cluster transcriptional repressor MraZ [Paracoccus sp. (in: a-proteobacteria)]|uniref:cell division/cell wall cluster transcriptional repressor MraZ n=1 Tax=Paracoccus sp. TaxID=267 RepID=UPI0026E0BB13|nr:cell division/cell wall cluster transcriptional repressor MraZ [Paracoccus sp. (in: a-proteobacteria)]MDO5647052.1 cell division/cell wall cluster transcriptional repressor MraZ [Paracoccus sp. (in: a-proteobacteria)]